MSAGTDFSIGVDIGGTKIAAGLIDSRGQLLSRLQTPTPTDPDAVVDSVVGLVETLREVHAVNTVGVAAPGFVSKDRAVVHHAPNIAWQDEPLRDRLENRLSLTVVLDNDANAAGWAEYRFGAAQDSSVMVMLTLGTGVGGAIVLDGSLFRGANGMAAELGHINSTLGGRRCGCGQRGCLEQYASDRALQRSISQLPVEEARALHRERDSGGAVPPTEFEDLVDREDPAAVAVIASVTNALGRACADFQAVLDPDCFVIGGGLASLGSHLLRPVERSYLDALPGGLERPRARFVQARMGNDAGIVGAADLAREATAARQRVVR